MSVELSVKPDRISVEDLIEIYGLFCKAYEINIDKSDERFFRSLGIQALHGGHLDYRPFMGAKFFGQWLGNSTQFHGYTNYGGYDQKVNDNKFRELVIQRFGRKLD
ncbi:MAG: hypothetical protein NT129_02585 [Candidatus Aenigmarchaeota archaeon]|nr:hypothetical protein [Candidatus Aenigmarchaeota archaeon]